MSHNRDDPSSSIEHKDNDAGKLPAKVSSTDGDTESRKTKKQDQLLNKAFLSKNALYTPMAGYDQDEVDPSHFLATKSSIPKSVQESSLVQFYRNVSVDYHYQNPNIPSSSNMNGNDYKYAGASRPISLADVDDRIRQRTVTLLGGGIHTVATRSSPMPLDSSAMSLSGHLNSPESSSLFAATNTTGNGSLKKRRRRRKRPRSTLKGSNEEQPNSSKWKIAAINSMERGNRNESSPVTSYQLDFVRQLNSFWNDYMLQVLHVKTMTSSEKHGTTKIKTANGEGDDVIQNRLCRNLQLLSMRHSLELVGAHVRILSCLQNLSLVGKTGIVVSHSQNCFTIAMIQTVSTKKKVKGDTKLRKAEGVASDTKGPNTTNDQSKLHLALPSHGAKHTTSKSPTADHFLKSVMVPKRGSSIGVLLRIPSSETAAEQTDPSTADLDAAGIDLHGIDSNDLISLVPSSLQTDHRTLCVVLTPS